MDDICRFDEVGPQDGPAVGGKGLQLALLAQAGLPVPPGFCLTTAAYRRWQGQLPGSTAELTTRLELSAGRGSGRIREGEAPAEPGTAARQEPRPPEHSHLRTALSEAYQQLGGGPVAVRSSAPVEDQATASFAGQLDTILGVTGVGALLDAISQCWASLRSDRMRAYCRQQGIPERELVLAVVVQQLVPAEVAGVLFTRHPLDPARAQMLVEAAWGLGESVVSGRVSPDRYLLDPETGAVLEQHICSKALRRTPEGWRTVPVPQQDQPCLDPVRLAELAALGRRVEQWYGEPRDVEWAWAEGRFWLLQARPITTLGNEREQVRQEEIATLQARAAPEGTVWSRYNLAEVLPAPTPMTWSIVRHLLSGRGGFGLMYRDLGFDPDPALEEDGVFDLICGRPYCNLSREPRWQFRDLPLGHSFAALKAAPERAIYPQPAFQPERIGMRFWLRLPVLMAQLLRASYRVLSYRRTFPRHFREVLAPAFAAATAEETACDPGQLSSVELLEKLQGWIRRTLYDFARDSLKPTALAGIALGNLERLLRPALGPARTQAALGELSLGVHPDPEADLAAAVRALAAGHLDRAAFLKQFGHRGPREMELAQPRWAEEPARLDQVVGALQTTRPVDAIQDPPAWERIAREAQLRSSQRKTLAREVDQLHTFLSLRETAKHYLMYGYALLRRLLLEWDRRADLQGGIFFLTLEELPRLREGGQLASVIATRRRRRALALGLEVPPVLFSDDLEAIGRPQPRAGLSTFHGVPVSPGVAEGPALVRSEPTLADLPTEPYILVCSSTDPAWVPLFVQARGLVLEMGGVLSHGALVAREFGLPAVAGLPGIVHRLRSGQRLRVDGQTGAVTVLAEIPGRGIW